MWSLGPLYVSGVRAMIHEFGVRPMASEICGPWSVRLEEVEPMFSECSVWEWGSEGSVGVHHQYWGQSVLQLRRWPMTRWLLTVGYMRTSMPCPLMSRKNCVKNGRQNWPRYGLCFFHNLCSTVYVLAVRISHLLFLYVIASVRPFFSVCLPFFCLWCKKGRDFFTVFKS